MRHRHCRLQQWINAGGDDDFTPLFEALADQRQAPEAQLPDTGVGLERERWLSSAFIRGEQYGTRASTVVAIGHDGHGVIAERRFGHSPGELFFTDDNPANVVAARGRGWHAHLFKDASDLEAELRGLGLLG